MERITFENQGQWRTPYGTVANCLKTLRKRKELTQCQLADRVGVSQSAIASYESGRICPSKKTTYLLADVLNVPFELIAGHRKTLFRNRKGL